MNNRKAVNWRRKPLRMAITLATVYCALTAVSQAQAADEKAGPEVYQTLYLTNLTQQNDANELVADLRNMLPKAKLTMCRRRAPSPCAALQRTSPSHRRSSPTWIRPRRFTVLPTP